MNYNAASEPLVSFDTSSAVQTALDFSSFCDHADKPTLRELKKLRSVIISCLKHYPYYVLVRDYPISEQADEFIRLSKLLGYFNRYFGLPQLLRGRLPKDNITQIKLLRTDRTDSRSGIALPPHTDGSFLTRPFDIVMLHCVRSDEGGGESIMVAIDDILQESQNILNSLYEPLFPFNERRLFPIITGGKRDRYIRYYRREIDHCLSRKGEKLPERTTQVLDYLDRVINSEKTIRRFKLKPGELLIINNKKALHGRTALTGQTNRLLYRARLFSDSL